MDIVKFVNVNQLTDTGRLLTSMIFNNKSLPILQSYGLMNVYLDDYGCFKRYEDCLFFLFNNKKITNYDEFEKTLANFKSFYDYYDVKYPEHLGELRMYVFKVHNLYRKDLFAFKHERFHELSDDYFKIAPQTDFSNVSLNYDREIYRFSLSLDIDR